MKTFVRLVFASLIWLSLLTVDARAQSNAMAFNFRMSDSGATTVPGVSTGRAVVSKGRVRMDVKGTARGLAMPGMAPGDDVSLILLDGGKTVIYINPKTKQYMQINPIETMERMQKMMEGMGALMKFEFTGNPKVENVGPGPVILGHKTRHYRITTGMKMTVSMMGESQATEMSAVSDQYLALDLKNMTDPFSNMASSSSMGSMGASNKEYVARLRAAQAKLPKALELRTETQVRLNAAGQSQNLRSVREITAIESTRASDDLFMAPKAFTKVELPLGPAGGRIPPE
jgi:hypothetical protein